MVVFRGMCDASGAVVLSDWLFAVGDDEDNILRVYDGRVGNLEGAIKGERVSLGTPYFLDLDGRGVRSISYWRGTYLLIGGATTEGGAPLLFTWDGQSQTPQPVPVDLSDLNPEAFVTYEDKTEFLLLSDDGSRELGGKRCKKLPAQEKQFRGMWVTLP